MAATLQSVAEDQRQYGRSGRTQDGYVAAAEAFSAFLAVLPAAHGGWADCSPMHILLFCNRHWLPTRDARSEHGVAPTTLNSMLAQLARNFEVRGQRGAWQPDAQRGNPVQSAEVSDFKHTYARRYHTLGGRERSAVPLRDGKVLQLLEGLDAEAEAALGGVALGASSKKAAWLLRRDSTVLAMLWHSCRRNSDVMNLHWHQVYVDTAGTTALSAWERDPQLVPEQLYCIPSQTKTAQASRPPTIVLAALPAAEAGICAVRRLRQFHSATLATRGECSGPLFCSSGAVTGDTRALTTSAMQQRLKRALRAHGLNEGETLHGFRRGRLQHEEAQGMTADALGALASISTPSVLSRYRDTGRHLA